MVFPFSNLALIFCLSSDVSDFRKVTRDE